MKIFVAKLNFSTSSEALREAFEQFGEVASANVITDRETGRSKGYGFVEMSDENEASAAIAALDIFTPLLTQPKYLHSTTSKRCRLV
jgi:RNA recognition motif-containing protein